MAIRDVSTQYAAFLNEAVEEENSYGEACEEACKRAKEAEEKELNELEVEEVDLAECGFEEADEDPVEEAEKTKEMEKRAEEALAKAKKSVTSTLNEEEVEKWLDENKAKIEKIFADSKIKDEKVRDGVKKLLKILERYSRGKLEESVLDEKKGKSLVFQLVKAIMRFFNWVLMLCPKAVIAGAWLLSKASDYVLQLQKKIDSRLEESLNNEIEDEKKAIAEAEAEEVIEADGCTVKKADEEEKCDEAACRNEEDPVTHLLDPVGVKASTANLAAQNAVGFSVVESLLKKIEKLESQLLESKKEKEEVDEAQYDMTKSAGSIASILIAHQQEWQGITDKNALVEYLKKMLAESGVDTPYSRRMMLTVQQKNSSLEIIDYLFRGVILGGKGLQVNGRRWSSESEEEKIEEAEAEEKEQMTEAQYDDAQAQKKLTYDEQLKFKRWAMRKASLKGDPFYFDYVTGVDGNTNEDIPNLVADGSITWGQALDAVKTHFGIHEAENPDDAKADKLDIDADKYEEEQKARAELSAESDISAANEADTSFEEDPNDEEPLPPKEDSPDFKRAKRIQELSFERKLTKAEEDQFRDALSRLTDIEKDKLLDGIGGDKTGFARPANHTGRFYRGKETNGERVEISPFNYLENPDDHNEKRSIYKKQQKQDLADEIKTTQDNALSSIDASLSSDQDVDAQNFKISLETLSKKERKQLMDELVADVEAEYEGREDATSKKAREDEIFYIWNIFGYDPNTRDLGKAWKVSHRGAGKYQNNVMQKIKDAFSAAGITSVAGLSRLSNAQFKKMLDDLKGKTASRKSWKIDPKTAEERIASKLEA